MSNIIIFGIPENQDLNLNVKQRTDADRGMVDDIINLVYKDVSPLFGKTKYSSSRIHPFTGLDNKPRMTKVFRAQKGKEITRVDEPSICIQRLFSCLDTTKKLTKATNGTRWNTELSCQIREWRVQDHQNKSSSQEPLNDDKINNNINTCNNTSLNGSKYDTYNFDNIKNISNNHKNHNNNNINKNSFNPLPSPLCINNNINNTSNNHNNCNNEKKGSNLTSSLLSTQQLPLQLDIPHPSSSTFSTFASSSTHSPGSNVHLPDSGTTDIGNDHDNKKLTKVALADSTNTLSDDNLTYDTSMVGKCQQLLIYYQNVRSIKNKAEDIYLNSLHCQYDIIVITESWLDNSISSTHYFDSNNYLIYRKDRNNDKTKGGGVLCSLNNLRIKNHHIINLPLEITDISDVALLGVFVEY
ncbi:putative mediator of RNA polymerase II transcription subunit 24 [Aphidius gifuensis]|uniref:putative mediator of RNA polymerase II transcription subunit 24 n=1 Tax=Aphidius gifuensis TaxID=684658 RepID=UPI001CDCBEA5|nr:putative mediator of RNA polymerase II transcription subunit 24 [Aphidius gifuensis]